MISRYGRSRKNGDWWTCRDLATALLSLDQSGEEEAEAFFALGFAQEKLGNKREAELAYWKAIGVNVNHGKSQRSLARLRR